MGAVESSMQTRLAVMSIGSGTSHEEVAVGIVGIDGFVRRMIDLSRAVRHPALRVLPAIYRKETAAATAARRIAAQVDCLLFAGPLPYHAALETEDFMVPCTYVPTGGPSLHGVIVRALATGSMDPQRLSIDSITEAELSESYAEIDLSPRGVHCMPYTKGLRPDDFLHFHEQRHAAGSSGAITTVPTVHEALQDANIPTLRMVPSTMTLRQALNNAILVGRGARFEESRIAVVIVKLPERALPPRTSPAQYWYQELRLTLHRELLLEARGMEAIVVPTDQHSFLMFTTVGSLRNVTDELTMAPLVSRISTVLGIDLEVGIGLGSSILAAETNAYRAIELVATDAGRAAVIAGPNNLMLRLPADGTTTPQLAARHGERDLEIVRALIAQLNADGQSTLVVDAERVAGALGVTLRTARRTLQNLVDAGLAWPMPPPRDKKVGRPPSQFQLLEERIGDVS